jgi:hypothetical protein
MVRPAEVPPESLLGRYANSGAYTDCYVTELPLEVTHAQFVEAFYTTPLFKVERLLLSLFLSRPATDLQAKQLAAGQLASFAAWSVESRAENELVLSAGRTRSWLMVIASSGSASSRTQLLFGSAVLPSRGSSVGRDNMGLVFTALLGFHKLYSRALLLAARSRLSSQFRRRAGGSEGEA